LAGFTDELIVCNHNSVLYHKFNMARLYGFFLLVETLRMHAPQNNSPVEPLVEPVGGLAVEPVVRPAVDIVVSLTYVASADLIHNH
jgi:hypothetical protein